MPSKPVVFMKPTTCLLNPGEDVWMPSLENGHTLDWEGELAVVIGKKCRNVAPEDALNYVAGYTVCPYLTVCVCLHECAHVCTYLSVCIRAHV